MTLPETLGSMVDRAGFEPAYGKPGQIYSLLPLTTRPPVQVWCGALLGGASRCCQPASDGRRPAGPARSTKTHAPAWTFVERVTGIEPVYSAWKAAALPLCYTRGASAAPPLPPGDTIRQRCASAPSPVGPSPEPKGIVSTHPASARWSGAAQSLGPAMAVPARDRRAKVAMAPASPTPSSGSSAGAVRCSMARRRRRADWMSPP